MEKTKATEKTVNVLITAEQRVRYRQVVSMTPDEWAKFKAQTETEATEVLSCWLDLSDVCDADDFEEGEWEAIAVDENNNPVKPRDAYEGE